MKIYGESQSEDCPYHDGADCYCVDKSGFMLFTAVEEGKPLHAVEES